MSDSNLTQKRQAWRRAIALKENELRTLEIRREALQHELRSLRAELRTSGTAPVSSVEMSKEEKLRLFRSLFRGREDIYSTLWTNKKTGHKGYALVCGNEWRDGICQKPRVRCGACSHQAFQPIADSVLVDHFRGRHVVGIYPLLKNEKCWFLAVDFDQGDWKKDLAAFREVCHEAELPVAIERSRSGNGAHAWFFFDQPVSAAIARRMGCSLITQTMSRCHSLGFSSYDRLFPNQDTLPKGGFGNLIALPLQREPRWNGNTVFVDDEYVPMPDQWAYLASIKKISVSAVERIAWPAAQSRQVAGARFDKSKAKRSEEESCFPALSILPQLPSIPHGANVPLRVQSCLAQRLYIDKSGLPDSVLNALKRLASFQNPEFYKRQNLRLSTALTPRVICCAEESPQYLSLPRGCADQASQLLQKIGTELQIDDDRQQGTAIDHGFYGELTELQKSAVRSMLQHDIGILVAPPGAGKTVAAIKIIARRGANTLIIVHRQVLLEQWVAHLGIFLRTDVKSIGRIGGGKRHVTGRIDVAMIQSLARKDQVAELVKDYGHVVIDECHHVAAVSFEKVLNQVSAKYITGLTATEKRRDGQHPIFEMQLGPQRYAAKRIEPSSSAPPMRRLKVRTTDFKLTDSESIQGIYRELAADEERNNLIAEDIVRSIQARRSPIVLTERKDHLQYLTARLTGLADHLIVLQGGVASKRRRETLAALDAIGEDEERIILATGRYIGEGFDDARLDTLFLTMPVSWRGTIVQYAGRLNRLHPRKTDVRIYDYLDRRVPVLVRMYERCLKGYRSIGYSSADDQDLPALLPRGTAHLCVSPRKRNNPET